MTGIQHISITAWPGGRQPAPPATCFPVMLSDGGIAIDWGTRETEAVSWPETLPADLYLRGLVELDLNDLLAVTEFVSRYGWFCKPDWESLPQMFTHKILGLGELLPDLAAIDALTDGIAEARWMRRREEPAIWETVPGAFRGFLHPEEIRVHAQFLRNATRAWDALSGGRPLEQMLAEWEGEFGVPQLLADGHWVLETATWVYLTETVNAALSGFHLRLELLGTERESAPKPVPATTYEVLALQLFNDVATHTAYRRCTNETCGRLFSPVPMSAKYGSGEFHGEKYCSVQCARAQSQREYRRRKKAEKAETEDS